MKKIVFTILFAMFVMPVAAFASTARPSDTDDTIPATPRCDKYYYTKWFDDCPNWRPNGVWDSCFCFKYKFHRYLQGTNIAKWEYAHNKHMKVKGLVAMVQNYNPPTVDTAANVQKLPEYLYLYQMTSATHRVFQEIEDLLQFELLDSVRWDTATARVMEFRQGWNDEYVQYCYLYEAYFEQPVWVDTDFFIVGSTYSGYNSASSHGRIPTVYVDIMDLGEYMLDPKAGCDIDNYLDLIGSDGPLYQDQHSCQLPGRPYAFYNKYLPIGWLSDWPLSPVGYYLVIVDKWDLDAEPNETGWGEVLGGGRFPDESDDTIEAVPAPGFAFVSWDDGVTDNPRVIHLTADTSFVAIFQCTQQFNLQVFSSDDAMGTVTGGGSYYASDVTITATPNLGYKLTQWNDGVTDNPRVVHLVSDTAFVAHFAEKEHYTVETASNNDEWGSVNGGGVYMEGEEATLTVTTEPFCVFDGWSDGNSDMPRYVTVTQDTLFTALFSNNAGVESADSAPFTLRPNPTRDRLTVERDNAGPATLEVFNAKGQKVMTMASDQATVTINVSSLVAGSYLLRVTTAEGSSVRSFVVGR